MASRSTRLRLGKKVTGTKFENGACHFFICRRLWEHRIHPPEPVRLKFFNDKRYEAITGVWRRFCKKIVRGDERASKKIARKAVERRSKKEGRLRTFGFSGARSSVVDEAKWSKFWGWRRVIENDWARTYEDRYEQMVKGIKI